MNESMPSRSAIRLIDDGNGLERLLHDLKNVDLLAIDLEANGFHAFRAKLCVIQLAWQGRNDEITVAIIDPLAVDIAPLETVLGNDGPTLIVLSLIHI